MSSTTKLGIAIVIGVIVFASLYFGIGIFIEKMHDCVWVHWNTCWMKDDTWNFLYNNNLLLSLIGAVLAAGLFLAISPQKSTPVE